MIIYLSPAKSLKKSRLGQGSDELFLNKRKRLTAILQSYNQEELKKLYQSSDKIAKQMVEAYHTKESLGPAIHVYDGIAFKSLEYSSLHKKHQAFANTNLLIGDAYYGLVLPQTEIHRYRLDFNMNLKPQLGIDLVSYWQGEVNDYLRKNYQSSQVFFNLASDEYSRLLDLKHFDTVIQPRFLVKNKIVSFEAKKARGLFARFVIENPNKKIEFYQSFNLHGYTHLGNFIFAKD